MSNSFIWPIDKTLLDAATPGQGGPENSGNEGVPIFSKAPCLEPHYQID